jgi:sulfite exporter TauE/SafE
MQINACPALETYQIGVIESLQFLTAWCGALPVSSSMIAGLFLAGAAGSALHCVPMCGGFVLGQVADRMASLPTGRLCEWRRYRAGVLLPYHLGRMTTYAGLGAIAGAGGAALTRIPFLAAMLLAVSAVLFVAMAVRGLAAWLPALRLPVGIPARVRSAIAGLNHRSPAGGYLLGIALGFLPCGFIYAALTAAIASGDPLLGAAGMAAFAAGTAPALMAVGIAGQAAGHRWRAVMASAAPFIMVLNAALLTALAIRSLPA